MTATVRIVKGTSGITKDIPVTDEVTGAAADLSNYSDVILTIKTLDETALVESITGSNLTIETGGLVRWVLGSTETDMAAGLYAAQLEFTGGGIVDKTYRFPLYVEGSLT